MISHEPQNSTSHVSMGYLRSEPDQVRPLLDGSHHTLNRERGRYKQERYQEPTPYKFGTGAILV